MKGELASCFRPLHPSIMASHCALLQPCRSWEVLPHIFARETDQHPATSPKSEILQFFAFFLLFGGLVAMALLCRPSSCFIFRFWWVCSALLCIPSHKEKEANPFLRSTGLVPPNKHARIPTHSQRSPILAACPACRRCNFQLSTRRSSECRRLEGKVRGRRETCWLLGPCRMTRYLRLRPAAHGSHFFQAKKGFRSVRPASILLAKEYRSLVSLTCPWHPCSAAAVVPWICRRDLHSAIFDSNSKVRSLALVEGMNFDVEYPRYSHKADVRRRLTAVCQARIAERIGTLFSRIVVSLSLSFSRAIAPPQGQPARFQKELLSGTTSPL